MTLLSLVSCRFCCFLFVFEMCVILFIFLMCAFFLFIFSRSLPCLIVKFVRSSFIDVSCNPTGVSEINSRPDSLGDLSVVAVSHLVAAVSALLTLLLLHKSLVLLVSELGLALDNHC